MKKIRKISFENFKKNFASKFLTMMLLNQACQQFSIKEKRRKELALSTQ